MCVSQGQLEFVKNTVQNVMKINNKYNDKDCGSAILFL